MISADFYPTAIQFDAPSYAPTFHLTDKIMDCDPDTFSNYYWLGWLAWDNFPDCWKLSGYTLTNTELIFNIATQPQNINIGYASKYGGTSGGNAVYPECYHESPLVNVGSPSARYINKLDVMGVGNSGVNFGWHCSYIYGEGDSLTNRGYNDGSFTKAGKALYDFLYGDTTQTIQIATGITYELDFNNMDEDGSFHFTTTYNDNNYDFVISFSYCALRNMRNVSSTASASTQNVNAYPMFSLTMDGDIYSFMATDAAFYHPSGYPCCIVNKSTQQPTSSTSAGNIIGDYIANGLNCTIPKAFITSSPSYSRLITGNAHVFNRGSDIAVYRMLTRSEMQKIVGLSLRQSDGTYNTYGYQNELSYAPYITEDNEFTATLITGDLSDDEFKAKLRPWQYDVDEWAENDYTEEDLPPYEGGDDEDEESGTRIPNQFRYFTGTNNFISQYAMKASQIQTFGQMLWNSWADSQTFVDAVNNFWIALNIENFTGSFDISSVMNFIVSLKVFPFNITHFDTTANPIIETTDTLRIGRGTFPFLFPSAVGNFYKVLSNIVYIDCGLIHDPTTGQYGIPRKFNDFRDYTNVSITCFCPYCGTVELNAGDVVGRQLSCKYAVDLQSGECLCLITVADSTGDLYNVAAISGNMGAEIPVSATNSGLIQSRRLSDAGNALGLFGGMFTENMSMGSNTFARAKDSQSSIGAIASATSQAAGNLFKDIKQTSNFAANMLSRGAIGCPIMQGGSGFAAFSQADTPYVQIRYGIYSEPANYSHSVGRISTKSDTLSNYKDSGLVICENVDVSGFTCHEDERSEIKALLESGVYL